METITVRCAACENQMRVGADKAGRKAKCPKCGNAVTIPAAEVPPQPPPPTVTAAPPPAMDDDDGPPDYGLIEETGPRTVMDLDAGRGRPKTTKKLPKIQRRVKNLPDKDLWEAVNTGLLFLLIGTTVWLAVHLLHGLYVVLGNIDFPEYSRIILNEMERQPPDRLNMLVGMISGKGLTGFARGTMILCAVLSIVQALIWLVGYAFCFKVPNRFGTVHLVSFATATGVINLLNTIFLRLLPLVGAYNLILIPLLVPEISLTAFNIERSIPVNLLWSRAPFWENFSTLLVEFLLVMEPVLIAEFLWSVGLSLRNRRLEERGKSLVQLGLGQYFVLLAYHLMAVCGTTMVLVIVLKVLYVLWYCFALLLIAWLASGLMQARALLAEKIANPGTDTADNDEDE